MDRTAAEQNLSLRDPPQAENPAEQDSIFIMSIFLSIPMSTVFKNNTFIHLFCNTIGFCQLI